MPDLTVNSARLHYEEHGDGPETIVFSHGLLWSGEMFGAQVKALSDRYRCITYDHRGQGKSEVTDSGYDMDTLTDDAAALIETLGAAPCHFVGLSMGGFVGQRLAIRRPELLRSLTLIETSADPEPEENVPRYRLLNFIARWFGLWPVAGRVMPIMFGQTFLNHPARADERRRWRKVLTANHRVGISRATAGVIEREGVTDRLDRVTVPTLILVGDEDTATVPAKSRRMHERIAGSRLVVIPRAGHSSTIEEPEAVTAALREFLQSRSPRTF
jgi:3-oxoadipate enol-lactonase